MNNERATQLASSFARAQQLTKAVANPEFDKYAANLKNSGYIGDEILMEDYTPQKMLPYNPNSMPTNNSYDARTEMQRMQQGNIQPTRNNLNLPKSILEDIRNNPIDGISADPAMDAFTNQLASVLPQPTQRKPMLSEQFQPTQPPTNNSSFDYEMMKMIIEGVVKKYIEPLKENLLTESNGKNNSSLKMMKIGKNFQFMDDSGNIYEAVLTFKGNVNEMRKKKAAK